jgi:hypothetical protein
LTISLTKSSTRSQYTGKLTAVRVQPKYRKDFDVTFATAALFGHILLVSKKVQDQPEPQDQPKVIPFVNKFDTSHFRLRNRGSKGSLGSKFTVNALGGKGAGRTYYSDTKIDQVDLGSTIVGVLEEIEGFGGEIGDGWVMIS